VFALLRRRSARSRPRSSPVPSVVNSAEVEFGCGPTPACI